MILATSTYADVIVKLYYPCKSLETLSTMDI